MRTLVTAAADVLLDLEEIKQHVRVDDDDSTFDAILTRYAIAAQSQVEAYLGRALLSQTWRYTTGRLVAGWRLDVDDGPNATMTQVEVLSGGSYVDVTSISKGWQITPGYLRIAPASGQAWPAADLAAAAYRVTYTVGYGKPSDVPAPIIVAALLIVGDLHTNREAKVTANQIENRAVLSLLGPYRAPGV